MHGVSVVDHPKLGNFPSHRQMYKQVVDKSTRQGSASLEVQDVLRPFNSSELSKLFIKILLRNSTSPPTLVNHLIGSV